MSAPGLSLIGPRATGKSTVGRLLADRLGWPFEDADQALEARLGRSIASLFADEGEAAFRQEEERTLQALTQSPPRVLATGGGAVLRPSNREALRRFGFVAWLSADAHALAHRLRTDPGNRPSLTGLGLVEEIQAVLQAREPLYRDLADVEISTLDRSPSQVADAVLDAFSLWRESRR